MQYDVYILFFLKKTILWWKKIYVLLVKELHLKKDKKNNVDREN